jgi:hypothetical protein
LRDYIDAAFEGMMDAVSLSVPVRYFLCMLDKQETKQNKQTDKTKQHTNKQGMSIAETIVYIIIP